MRHRTNPHAKTAAAIMRDVEANVRAFDRLQSATDRIDPRSALDAKFSLQYVLSRAIVDGCVAIEHFEGEAHADPRVRASYLGE